MKKIRRLRTVNIVNVSGLFVIFASAVVWSRCGTPPTCIASLFSGAVAIASTLPASARFVAVST